jgi:hypothetical protein
MSATANVTVVFVTTLFAAITRVGRPSQVIASMTPLSTLMVLRSHRFRSHIPRHYHSQRPIRVRPRSTRRLRTSYHRPGLLIFAHPVFFDDLLVHRLGPFALSSHPSSPSLLQNQSPGSRYLYLDSDLRPLNVGYETQHCLNVPGETAKSQYIHIHLTSLPSDHLWLTSETSRLPRMDTCLL